MSFNLVSFFSVLWKSLLLCTCASPFFHILIVSEVNPCIVWLLTAPHLARPSAVPVNVWGITVQRGCAELVQTTPACRFTYLLLQVVNDWEMYCRLVPHCCCLVLTLFLCWPLVVFPIILWSAENRRGTVSLWDMKLRADKVQIWAQR